MDTYVYIMTNKRDGTLYVGSTTDLVQRVYAHKEQLADGFTKKYNLNKLVYYEALGDEATMVQREHTIKRWKRSWKVALIEGMNPEWRDLWEDIL
jgi:putative endonuclease